MIQSLKYVTYFLMYYTHMTLPSAGVMLTRAEFLFHFIGKMQFKRAMLSWDRSYLSLVRIWLAYVNTCEYFLQVACVSHNEQPC